MFIFSLLPQKREKVILPQSNQKKLFSYHFSYSYIPLITWIPITPTSDWTIQKPDIEEKKSLTDKVKLKEAEIQTDPGFVTVAVKEVCKTYDISVKESLRERIEHKLVSVWNDNRITEFMVKKEQNTFSVDISCRKFSESFTASLAARLLTYLPWPDGISVIRSKPTRYTEKNQ